MRDPEMMVTPMEARKLFEESTLFDMQQAYLLHKVYQRQYTTDESGNQDWEYTRQLAFLYSIGRIQGVREERYRRRKAHSMRGRGSAQN